MVIYDYFGLHKATPANTLCSLGFLLVGLCLFTVNDVQFNFLGSLVALVAVVTTTIYQTQINGLQKVYEVTGVQLNQAVALARFVIALIAAFSIESYGSNNMFQHHFHGREVGMILFTGCLAVMGNTVGFILIGRAGAITFQVVGHVKTITVFVFGLLMFPPKVEPPTKKFKKIAGLCIAMLGVMLYTFFPIKNKTPESQPSPSPPDLKDRAAPALVTKGFSRAVE
jgi:solute carrier family 35 protein E3